MAWPTVHTCNELALFLKGDKGTYFTIRKNHDAWYLTIVRCAGEQEVRDGEAEYMGEEKLNYTFMINFCPFCGLNLDVGVFRP